MVGVAGRSKACKNCTKRRVKCDETRPICKRCLKAKLTCGDWPPSLTVIQFEGHTKRQQQTPELKQKSPMVEESALEVTRFSDPLSPWSRIMIPSDDIFVNYTWAHLLRSSDQMDQTVVPGVDRTLSDQCFLALATSYFGNEHCEQGLVQRGFRRYSSALKGLHEALCDVSKSKTYDVLESVIVMALFEMLMSDSSDGWIAHSLGLERLMELRGPESFRKLPDRAILQTSRPTVIFAAIVLHKSTILSNTRWKTIPWDENPSQKDPFQYLVDILADCPQLLVLKDHMYASKATEEAQTLASELEEHTQTLLAQLEIWKASWDASQGDYYSETPVTSSAPSLLSPNGPPIPFWTTNYQYNTLRQANAMAMYNAAIILLLKILQELTYSCTLPSTAQLLDRMYTAGIEICRSAEYHLQVMREGAGSFYILFPLRMAWDAVGKVEPAIGVWLTDVLQQVQSGAVGRWAIAGYLLNINAPAPEPEQERITES
ncbi:hypothetical protein BU16DRAFT_136300 [Lophium mytilinum]|uniref:Zn(2)-C6 fungal-type domain-containing protein n=1 Tax=Lophium mytilinum TaxID=390894 RepID=A0A6A6QFT7_9PEZI|nr:hypothetical protein BU16DRAFT_136300 [Lophium mytilinum]